MGTSKQIESRVELTLDNGRTVYVEVKADPSYPGWARINVIDEQQFGELNVAIVRSDGPKFSLQRNDVGGAADLLELDAENKWSFSG